MECIKWSVQTFFLIKILLFYLNVGLLFLFIYLFFIYGSLLFLFYDNVLYLMGQWFVVVLCGFTWTGRGTDRASTATEIRQHRCQNVSGVSLI